MDEGYVKYQCFWEDKAVVGKEDIEKLNFYRNLLFEKKLIGYDKDHKVAYGNISLRADLEQFYITGTQTGHLPVLKEKHYSKVILCDLANNRLSCVGKSKASSEALTHYMVYKLHSKYKAVIHVHHFKMWNALKDLLPTSSPNVPYGTPKMAYEIKRLYLQSELETKMIMIMAGHKEGIIVFGKTLESAYQTLMCYFEPYQNTNMN